jgi:zinc transport system permease protein
VFEQLADLLGVSTLVLYPAIAFVLLGLSCGTVGSLVVANRMAFFSDAMAHTAFAGVAFGLLSVIVFAGVGSTRAVDQYEIEIALVMVAIGLAAGFGIGYVRERTGLTNDTVIGVFFALAIGVGSMLLPAVRRSVNVDIDQFLFGSVVFADQGDLWLLTGLAVATALVVGWRYNALVFASFNPSLARSRGVRIGLNNYLFIALLVCVVNLSVKSVGALLINALLVVPAAAGANLGRNLRQVFWWTVAASVGCGLLGLLVSYYLTVPIGRGREPLTFGPSGTTVVLCVLWFFATMVWAAVRRRGTGTATEHAG